MTQPLLTQLIGLSPERRRAVLDRVRNRGAGSSSISKLDRLATDGASWPASSGQGRLWFLWRLEPFNGTYHVSWRYEVAGGLDVARLAAAVDALVLRHEVLRTTLHEQDGQVVQRIGPPWRCGLVADPAADEQVAELAVTSARELFDLSAGRLLHVRAWELAPDRHVVAFTAHHVIMDGWSLELFEQELWAVYEAGGDPVAAGLSALDIQYADYAAWHRDLTASRADNDLAWWRQTLDGATPVRPVPDRTGHEHADFPGDQAAVILPASALDWLDAVRADASTDFVALFAVWCLFLARHTGKRDITVGTMVSGRSHPDVAALIGFFINTLALRVRIDPSADFPGYLRGVRAVVLDAYAHQEIPFDHVVRAVAPSRSATRNPLFSVLFSYVLSEAAQVQGRTLANGLKLTALPRTGGGSHALRWRTSWSRYLPIDLSLTASRTPGGLVLQLEYSTDLYDPATITGYLDSLASLLDAVGHDPAAPLAALLGGGQPAVDRPAEQAAGNRAGASADARHVAPATATEQRIARIWASLLGLDAAEICTSHDFFTIGGYSLLAVRLARQVGADLHVEFPVHQVFTTPTIAGQAAYADGAGQVPRVRN